MTPLSDRRPDPHQGALHLLPKLTPADNVKAYIYTSEQMAIREGWPEDEWPQILALLLTGEAQLQYNALPQPHQMTTCNLKAKGSLQQSSTNG